MVDPVGATSRKGIGSGDVRRCRHRPNVTRSRVRGKHPFDEFLDGEQAFDQGRCLTRVVRCAGQSHHRTRPAGDPMAAAAVAFPVRSPVRHHPRPRRRRHRTAAVYWRRRFVAVALGLGLVVVVGQRVRRSAGPPLPPPSAARRSRPSSSNRATRCGRSPSASPRLGPARRGGCTRAGPRHHRAAPGRDAHLARRLTRAHPGPGDRGG